MFWSFSKYAVIYILAFLFSGIVLNAFIRASFDPPYMGLLSEKLEAFEKNKDAIDIVFVGTSRTFRQMNTPLMEQRLEQKGCGQVTLFNLGVPNLTYAELVHVLDTIETTAPKRLKMVVMGEPMPAVRPQLERLRTERIRFFSDWTGSFLRLQNIWSYQEGVVKKTARTVISALGFGYEQSNIGHLSRYIFPDLYASTAASDPEMDNMPKDWMPTRGYWALELPGQVNDVVQKQHEIFLSQKDRFKGLLTMQQQAQSSANTVPSEYRLTLYKDLFARIQNNAQQVGLYIPPLPERVVENKALAQSLDGEALILNYNDPAIYPQFWDADLWFDESHLNDEGSRMLSTIIADRLCPLTKEWGL